MIICRGTPQYPGRYVCYLPGVGVATVIRVWEGRWIDVYGNPIAGKVAGWIGPLPALPKEILPQEYDL